MRITAALMMLAGSASLLAQSPAYRVTHTASSSFPESLDPRPPVAEAGDRYCLDHF